MSKNKAVVVIISKLVGWRMIAQINTINSLNYLSYPRFLFSIQLISMAQQALDRGYAIETDLFSVQGPYISKCKIASNRECVNSPSLMLSGTIWTDIIFGTLTIISITFSFMIHRY